MRPENLMRVVVVGTSCSGKTTFARCLAGHLGTRYVELDSLYWGHQWTPRADFQQQVRLVADEPSWVMDGNYSSVRDMIWRRATAVVWLDYSFLRVFSRALHRTIRRIALRERLYGGNQETISGALFDFEAPLWLVLRTHGRRRREFSQLLSRPEYRHATVIRLQAPSGASMLLAELGARAAGSRLDTGRVR